MIKNCKQKSLIFLNKTSIKRKYKRIMVKEYHRKSNNLFTFKHPTNPIKPINYNHKGIPIKLGY